MALVRWLRFHLASVVTVLTLGLGSLLLSCYFFAPETHIGAPVQGLGCGATIPIHLDYINLALLETEDPAQVWLYGGLKFDDQRLGREPYYLMLVFPFRVISKSESFSVFPLDWNYTIIGTGASVAYTKFSNNSLASREFSVGFYVAKTFMESKRGITTIVLPLERTVGGQTIEALGKKLEVSFFSPPQMTVYITLPLSAEYVQTFPETSSRTVYVPPGTVGQAINSIKWILTERKTITLYYLDRQIASRYEAILIVGSLLLGAGFSGLFEWLKSLSQQKSPSSAAAIQPCA